MWEARNQEDNVCDLRRLSMFTCLILIFSALLLGCQKDEKPLIYSSPKFAIYFVKEPDKNNALSYGRNNAGRYVKSEAEIQELALEKMPILTDKDIKEYDWHNQKIQLTDEYLEKHSVSLMNDKPFQESGSELLGAEEFDAVVIAVNGERVYKAGFPLSSVRSQFPPEIMICDSSDTSITISKNGKDDTLDPRYDKRIRDIFQNEGKLVEGDDNQIQTIDGHQNWQ